MAQIPTPDFEDPKEVYAFFGLTYYKAAVLEHGVLNLAVALLATNTPGVTVGDVDKLYESFDKHTFGQIVRAAKAKFSFPEALEADVAKALRQRNYLAHRFWMGHDIDIQTEEGRRHMIKELTSIFRHLHSVDERMDKLWMSAWEPLGITHEWIEEAMDRFMEHQKGKA